MLRNNRLIYFSLGDLVKDVVRKMASGAGLDKVADRKSSSGICFIGNRKFEKFISEVILFNNLFLKNKLLHSMLN